MKTNTEINNMRFTVFTTLPGCCTVKVLGLAAKFGDIIGGGQ